MRDQRELLVQKSVLGTQKFYSGRTRHSPTLIRGEGRLENKVVSEPLVGLARVAEVQQLVRPSAWPRPSAADLSCSRGLPPTPSLSARERGQEDLRHCIQD